LNSGPQSLLGLNHVPSPNLLLSLRDGEDAGTGATESKFLSFVCRDSHECPWFVNIPNTVECFSSTCLMGSDLFCSYWFSASRNSGHMAFP
jgi:hypothetical protein